MNKKIVTELFERFKNNNPNPTTELDFASDFELLIAVILSAQATDISVNKATVKLYAVANTPEAIYALGVAGLSDYIKSIGLYNSKAKNVIETCRLLVENHNSEIPQTREALEALPGVGRKTANVVLNTAYGQPTMAVDTHIYRVSNRLGLVKAKTVLECEKELVRKIPDQFLIDAHHWLLLHGRYVCKARKPDCQACMVKDLCRFTKKQPLNNI